MASHFLGYHCRITNPPFWSCAIYFDYDVYQPEKWSNFETNPKNKLVAKDFHGLYKSKCLESQVSYF